MNFYLLGTAVATILQPNPCNRNSSRSWRNQGNHRFSPAVTWSRETKTTKLHPLKSGLNSQTVGNWQVKFQRSSTKILVFTGNIKEQKLWESRLEDQTCILFWHTVSSFLYTASTASTTRSLECLKNRLSL